MRLPRYSLGIGDRFGMQGEAQISSVILAGKETGTIIAPVWNKSNREHRIIGTNPRSAREEADQAVRATGWTGPYFVDADHVNRETVEAYLPHADFFTLDVADAIGRAPSVARLDGFLKRYQGLVPVPIEGLEEPLELSREDLERFGRRYAVAIDQAAETYGLVEGYKGRGNFVTEVSMDETDQPQSPSELLLILAELAHAGVPVQTVAPKFTGQFYKGVDYVGDIHAFRLEFRRHLAVIAHAVEEYDLPEDLKLSVHSGSDKFSIYGPIHEALDASGKGLHLKTAGTTWLEEVTGLAEAGGEGLAVAKEVYRQARQRMPELAAPYAQVIDIDPAGLPDPAMVDGWTREQFANALRHDPRNPEYNRNLRQLVHIGFKIAAELGESYRQALRDNREIIAKNVTRNLYERHIKPVFLGA